MQLKRVGLTNLILILSLSIDIQERELVRFLSETKILGCVGTSRDIFETCYADRDHWSLHFDTSLNDLELRLRSWLHEKSKNAVLSFS